MRGLVSIFVILILISGGRCAAQDAAPPECPDGYHTAYHSPSNGFHGYYTCEQDSSVGNCVSGHPCPMR
jgi:hypothetical protein